MSRKVEYYGYIHNGSSIVNEKTYYFYDGEPLPALPANIIQWLTPFDISDRGDAQTGFSYFIKNTEDEALTRLTTVLLERLGLSRYNIPSFLDDFKSLSHIGEGSHYDPIVSIKQSSGVISGISFYINTVPDKSLCMQYWNEVKYYSSPEHNIIDILEGLMTSGAVMMYLFSWDFNNTGCYQNKIYVKVKNILLFKSTMCNYYPALEQSLDIDGYRLSDFAFALEAGKFSHFNIYFKPL